jgi:phosphatidate cytidylyltransferase
MKNLIQRIITSCILGTIFWISFAYMPPRIFSFILIIILIHIITVEWKTVFPIRSYQSWLLVPLYPTLSFMVMISMNENPAYHHLLLYLFIMLAGFDAGSYIVGSLIGKHTIMPSISPKKSWEGFLGGYCFALIGFWLIAWERGSSASLWFMILFTLSTACLALAGDLFESHLKRRASIKDSGTILPGHGGFLDRFDGILFAAFLFYFTRTWLAPLL